MFHNKCLIYRVCYGNKEQTHITHVEAHVDDNIGTSHPKKILTRAKVLEMIDDGYSVETVKWLYGDTYEKGAKVIAIPLNGNRYIKTESNETEEDNLGELPTFQMPYQEEGNRGVLPIS